MATTFYATDRPVIFLSQGGVAVWYSRHPNFGEMF